MKKIQNLLLSTPSASGPNATTLEIPGNTTLLQIINYSFMLAIFVFLIMFILAICKSIQQYMRFGTQNSVQNEIDNLQDLEPGQTT